MIAIFDIGKTNKKLLIFDENYQVVKEIQTQIVEIVDDDGFPCDDIDAIVKWVQESWSDLEASGEYEVKALNFTTYGASMVHLDLAGEILTPLYNYLKPYPEELLAQFYESVGGKKKIALETASPMMGMLNSGLQLYWLKHKKPDIFNDIIYSMHLPNYLAYLFTKNAYSDHTSLGCHTGMWDYRRKDYHEWINREEVEERLPTLSRSSYIGKTDFGETKIPVGSGLHDSSATLMPYLLQMGESFMLVSSGTWCVTMNPFAKSPLSQEELSRDCLNYMTFEGEPVKASRIFLGNEHAFQTKRLAEHFNKSEDVYTEMKLNTDLLSGVRSLPQLSPATMNGTGPFPDQPKGDWDISAFESYEQAYHRLMLDLVGMLRVSIELIRDDMDDSHLFVDGGFSRNKIFMALLASFFPHMKVNAAEVPHATALGAALLMHATWQKSKIRGSKLFNFKKYEALDLQALNA